MTSLEFKEVNDYLDPDFVFINFKKKMSECYEWAYKNSKNPISHLRYKFENEKILKHEAIVRFYETNDFKWILPKAIDFDDNWWRVKLFMDISYGGSRKVEDNFHKVHDWLDQAENDIRTDFDLLRSRDSKGSLDFKYAIGYNGSNARGLEGENYHTDTHYELFKPFRLDFCSNQEYIKREDKITPREALEAGHMVNFSHYVYENSDHFRTRDMEKLHSFKKLESPEYTIWHYMPEHCKSMGLDYTDPFNLKF